MCAHTWLGVSCRIFATDIFDHLAKILESILKKRAVLSVQSSLCAFPTTWKFKATALAVLTLALSGCGGADNEEAGTSSSIEQVLGAVVDMAVSQDNVQGLTVGLRKDSGEVWFRSGGYRDIAKTTAMDADLQYRIGSATKTFTATAVLQLVDQGLIGLDDTVATWLPELAVPNDSTITVRHLLEMRSGLRDYLAVASKSIAGTTILQEWSNFDDVMKTGVHGNANYSPTDLVNAASKRVPYFASGTAMRYSNTNYVLLGLIAEKASCKAVKGCRSVETLINDGIVKPLGMAGTYFPSDNKFTSTKYAEAYQQVLDAELYRVPEGARIDMTFTDSRVPWAAGAMLSTPTDELVWARELALNEKKLISDALFKERLTAKSDGSVSYIPVRYGMGVYHLPSLATGSELIGHSGLVGGYNTSIFYSPSLKLALSVNITGVLANPASWFPLYGAEDSYDGAFRFAGGFNTQTLVWNLERNLRLAIENTGSCSTLGTATGDGSSGSCDGDSVRTHSLSVQGRSLAIKPSGRVFNSMNMVTDADWNATLQSTTDVRPSLVTYGSQLSGLAVGDNGKVELQAGAILETIGVDSNGIAVTGTGGNVTVSGVVRSMGRNTVALRVADTAKNGVITVSKTAQVQGDMVLAGSAVIQLDGTVNGTLRVSGTNVKITGSGTVSGGVVLANGAKLADGSDITKLAAVAAPAAQAMSASHARKLPPLYMQ
jgi:CubicO group peptidase (beta-lactamase class C family)